VCVQLTLVNPLPPSDTVRKQKKCILEDISSSLLSQFKKYHPSENLKFNNFGIFQSLKFCILMGKILPISLKLNWLALVVAALHIWFVLMYR